jgi:hypothetical protein
VLVIVLMMVLGSKTEVTSKVTIRVTIRIRNRDINRVRSAFDNVFLPISSLNRLSEAPLSIKETPSTTGV